MATARILLMGDSITVGDDANPGGSRTYRGTLQTLLSQAGFDYNFVGPVYAPPLSGGTDPDVAAFHGCGIDSTTSATNNLTDRLAQWKIDYPSLELLMVYIGWNDLYAAPTNVASRYATFLNALQSGVWASVKAIICTLHPDPNQTEAQTNSSRAGYQALNTQIRSMASSSRIVADLAARSSGDAAAWLGGMIYDAQNAPDFQTIANGSTIPANFGGHNVTSFKSMQDFNANWSTNPPAPGSGPGGTGLTGPASAGAGHPRFINSVSAVVPWLWLWPLAGDTSNNTCIEARNGYAGALRANGSWGYFFQGARFGQSGTIWPRDGGASGAIQLGHRPDGITSFYKPHWNTGIEIWPEDTVPSRGITGFFGGFNRELMSNAICYIAGCQVRTALINPNGANDISSARFGGAIGIDFFSNLGGYHYDWIGWPNNAQDGGHDRWKTITSTEWTWITCVTIGSGSGGHWFDPGTPPPLSNYGYSNPYNNIPTYSLSAATLRNSPPPLPAYVSGGGSGYLSADYWTNTTSGVKDIHMTQSGADKLADTIAAAIRSSGVLDAYKTGVSPSGAVLPGLPTAPNYIDKLTAGLKTWGFKNWSTGGGVDVLPAWQTTTLIPARRGVVYSETVLANGVPTPTYSVTSTLPGWLSFNAGTRTLSGTPPSNAQNTAISFLATNVVGSAGLNVTLAVNDAVQILTTSLPNAIQNAAYSQIVEAAGVEPFTWSVDSGTLPAGLTLTSGLISGTPTAASGTASFVLRVSDATGQSDTQSLTITNGVAGNVPAITPAVLAGATVGAAYSQSLAATGAVPITWLKVSGSIPPGITVHPSTGVVSGTPTVSGSFGFTVRATNSFGFGEETFSILVMATAVAGIASPWGKFTGSQQ